MTEIEVDKPKAKNKFIHQETKIERQLIELNQRSPIELAPVLSRCILTPPSLVANFSAPDLDWKNFSGGSDIQRTYKICSENKRKFMTHQ
ncbi:MAG: hypothetical protein PVH37_22660 [Desulfobacterales bacterium]|jgi:hypothetical protein